MSDTKNAIFFTDDASGAAGAVAASGAGVAAGPQADNIKLASTNAARRANRVFFIVIFLLVTCKQEILGIVVPFVVVKS